MSQLENKIPETSASIPSEDPNGDPGYLLVDLDKYVRRIWRRKFAVVACAIVGACLGYGEAWRVHPLFDASVRLMPPDKKDSSILASLAPSRNEGDLFLGLITSRTVADDVIEHQHLSAYFHTSRPWELRRDLAAMAKITVDKDQFITVTVRAPEPETAVKIANAFPEALSRLNSSVSESEAQHRWEFIAGPLEQEKNKLADAEEQLKLAQQKTGVELPETQLQLSLSSISALNQQITSRQEQLAALETGSTDQNPQVIQVKSQIASLTAQRDHLQAQNGGSGKASSARMPELTLQVQRLAREVRFHEALFELLSRQNDNARIGDAYSPPVELVDSAVLPDEKAWPSRRLFALAGLGIGLLLGVVLVCFRR